MVIPILRTLIWMCSNLMLSEVKTTSHNNSSFRSYQSRHKKKMSCIALWELHSHNFGPKLYFNLFGYIGNLDPFLAIDISFFPYYSMNKDNQPTLSIIHQILKDADEENYFLDLLSLSCKDVDACSKELYLLYNKWGLVNTIVLGAST